MKKILLILIAAALVSFCIPMPAQSASNGGRLWLRSHYIKITCPYPTDGGCAAAPTDGAYQNAAFFTYAKQSGQGSYHAAGGAVSSHPPPWNVAGVDYPVGYSLAAVGGSLKDPTTASLPSGCVFSSPTVTCASLTNLTISGYDFSLHNCTKLSIGSSVTGTVTITNNKFKNGSNCSTAGGYLAVVVGTQAGDVDFENNSVDGDALNFPTSLEAMIWSQRQGNLTVKYNAVFRSPARPIESSAVGTVLAEFNYVEGFTYSSGDGHGEFIIDVFSTGTQPLHQYSFNTGLQPSNVLVNGSTTFWYATPGLNGGAITLAQVDHNTSVVNTNGGSVTTGTCSSEFANVNYTNSLLSNNYFDCTGAFYPFGSVSSPSYTNPTVFTNNINMLNGNTVAAFNSAT